jgi:simple sugar transport system substrate-binding protein
MADQNETVKTSQTSRKWIVWVAVIAVVAIVAGLGWFIRRTTAAAAETESGAQAQTIAVSVRATDSDFFSQWLAGVKAEAKDRGISLKVYDAKGDDSQQILDVQSAIALNPSAIIIDHALEGVEPNAEKALDKKIPVVSFDSAITDKRVITVSQSDQDLAKLVADRLVDDTQGTAKVIYAYVAGFAPLDNRNETWKKVLDANPGLEQVAQVGVVNDSTAKDTAEQIKASLQANPDVTAIFAPFDEFAKGATQAVEELGLTDSVKVYGVDISDADIAVLTKDNSPWVATATTDPSNDGRVSLRTAILASQNKVNDKSILIPPTLVTADQLRSKSISKLSALVQAYPSLKTDDISAVSSTSNN